MNTYAFLQEGVIIVLFLQYWASTQHLHIEFFLIKKKYFETESQ